MKIAEGVKRYLYDVRIFLLAFILFISVHLAFAQVPPPEYNELIKKAFSLYEAKDYNMSALTYSAAFKTFGWKGLVDDRYNAACSWALAGDADSAFFNLDRIASKGLYTDYDHIQIDTDLNSLHKDKRWKPLLKLVKENKEKSEANLNKPLIGLIDSMATADQKWRGYWIKYQNKEPGYDSLSIKTITDNWHLTDSLNYLLVRRIFNQYGFPNYDLVGQRGSGNFWLIVQHQDNHPTFQDSVLAAMKPEVDKGKASASNYAYLVDRVKVNTKQPQVYGTQMQINNDSTSYEPIPVIDPDQLNERRKSVGLSPIEEYIETMNNHYLGSLKKKQH